MSNPFSKGWNYLKASLDRSIEDNADPKVQVHQAMDQARAQHRQISDQAAAVIGNARRTEESIGTKERALDKLQGQVRQSVQLADDARAAGDEAKAAEWERSAEQLAAQLVSAEQDLEQTRSLSQQANADAEKAKQAVRESEARLQETLAQEDSLLLQAQQAKMAEQQQTSTNSITGEVSLGANPTFEQIRDKIEQRHNTAVGQAELAEASGAANSGALADAEALQREDAGRAKLDAIRAELHGGAGAKAQGGATRTAGAGAGNDADIDVTDTAVDEPNPATGGADAADAGGAADAPGFPRDTH
ncbi:PspA/IM30 family protein [Dietzia sp.]|uniref:PspA/IM30 family protein n=1 Tax=Dietzia sp. TaxID=1871616 RepID=UPI002FDB2A80